MRGTPSGNFFPHSLTRFLVLSCLRRSMNPPKAATAIRTNSFLVFAPEESAEGEAVKSCPTLFCSFLTEEPATGDKSPLPWTNIFLRRFCWTWNPLLEDGGRGFPIPFALLSLSPWSPPVPRALR